MAGSANRWGQPGAFGVDIYVVLVPVTLHSFWQAFPGSPAKPSRVRMSVVLLSATGVEISTSKEAHFLPTVHCFQTVAMEETSIVGMAKASLQKCYRQRNALLPGNYRLSTPSSAV